MRQLPKSPTPDQGGAEPDKPDKGGLWAKLQAAEGPKPNRWAVPYYWWISGGVWFGVMYWLDDLDPSMQLAHLYYGVIYGSLLASVLAPILVGMWIDALAPNRMRHLRPTTPSLLVFTVVVAGLILWVARTMMNLSGIVIAMRDSWYRP